MTAKNIKKFLRSFKWNILCKMYGSAHCSIIGFISSSWIDQSVHNAVLDGVPSPSKGRRRKGQTNADTLLFKQKKPYIVVEVESDYSKYIDKINSIQKYFKNTEEFGDLNFGLLVMTNLYEFPNGKKCWDIIKNKIEQTKYPIALVSIEKREVKLDKSPLDHLRGLNKNYKPKEIARIDYRIYLLDQKIQSGTLL
jgi:hypothetical protein